MDTEDSHFEFLAETQVSDYVYCKVDVDTDVHIIDTFIEVRRMALPKEEAIAVAKFILNYFEEN